MAGFTALRRIQIGKESTRGTAVAADKVLLGALTWNPTYNLYMPDDQERNSLAMYHSRTIVAQENRFTFNSGLNYDQIVDLLAMAIKGGVSASQPTNAVLTYDWTFLPSLTAVNTQDAYTFEMGDDQQEYESAFVVAEQLEFAVPMGEVGRVSANLFGRYPAKSTFTGALTAPTIEFVPASNFKLYIDSTWAGLGTTEVADVLVNATVRVPTGLQMVRAADGSLDFTTVAEGKRAAEVELTFLHNSDGEARYDEFVSGGLSFIRLEATGSEIEAVTPTYYHQLYIDLALRYTEPPQFFEDVNGNNAVRLAGRTFHDPTSGNDMSFFVRNKIATI